jgi:hypothetical protein
MRLETPRVDDGDVANQSRLCGRLLMCSVPRLENGDLVLLSSKMAIDSWLANML